MGAKPQFIERYGETQYAIIPYSEHLELYHLSEACEATMVMESFRADPGKMVSRESLCWLIEGE